ncbi:hypothetical protein NYE69_26405 [Paenibacillus sp. FSL R5-0527]|uniref:hypothetical protein n=1 Tax=Paenibacillus sp. FSL R5-0527 TaxID=2975321 RepID=UPI00097B0F43|nr:hypothetical protein BK140_10530 [Paenibacillus macerans]
MSSISESDLHTRFPWSKPVSPLLTDHEKSEGYFCDPIPWNFDEPVLRLIEQMFTEIEAYFFKKNQPVEIAIYGMHELFGELQVEMYSPHPEVYRIVKKYQRLSRNLLSNDDEVG